MGLQQLKAQRRPGVPSAPIDVAMRFTEDGLVWGLGTVLAPDGASLKGVEMSEPRLLALLAAAHLRLPTALALAHIRKAVESRRRRDVALAEMHLALSGLARFERPRVDARRLFLADRLLVSGFSAGTILKALDIDPPPDGWLSKYDPDEPRVPAGSGRTSGQWTTGELTGGNQPIRPSAPHGTPRPVGAGDIVPASDVSLSDAALRPGQSVDIELRGTRVTSPAVVVHGGLETRLEGADYDYERFEIPIQYDAGLGAGTLVGVGYIEAPSGSTVTLRLSHNGSLIALITNGNQTTAVRLQADVTSGTDFEIGNPEHGGIRVFAPSAQQAMQDYGNAHILDNPLAIPLLVSVGTFDWAVSAQFFEYIAARSASAEIAAAEGANAVVFAQGRVARITFYTARVRAFEDAGIEGILRPVGLGKNNAIVTEVLPDGRIVRTIVDSAGRPVGFVEFKDIRYLSRTRQITAQLQHADDNRLPYYLVVSKNTQGISGPLLRAIEAHRQRYGGGVYVYDPVKDILTPWEARR